MGFKLYVDDVKPAPSGWQLARTADEAKNFLFTGNVDWVSLDHDLGLKSKDGMEIVRFCVDHGIYPARVTLHSMNLAGRSNMFNMFLRYGPYRIVVRNKELTKV